jgi:HEAT repeat protein
MKLGKMPDERVIEALVFALGDPNHLVRQAAINALTQAGYRFGEVVYETLINVINSAV